MGHANVENISQFFVRRLHKKGKTSIEECVAALQEAGETVHASEGEYDEDFMLAMALGQVIHYLTRDNPKQHGYSGPGKDGGGPWIEPILKTARQRKVWAQYEDEETDDWDDEDYGDERSQQRIFDAIPFQLRGEWKDRWEDVPVLHNITN